MRLRRPTAESLLALCGAAVGLIGIASALTPEFANRLDVVQGVLPPGVPEGARVAALAFGVALVWLSGALARRRRRAWVLAVAVVIASAAAHLAKGLDVEEASISVALLVALLVYRKRFDVPGDPRPVRPLVGFGVAGLAAVALAAGTELRHGAIPDRVGDCVAAVGLLAAFYALYLWLRPLSEAVAQTRAERRLARELVDTYGRDSLSFFSLRHDKSFFFSPTRRAFLAYRVVSGVALVSGDPVGDEREFESLVAEFRRVAHARGWRVAILGASEASAARYRRLGLRAVPIGNEAVLDPRTFSLEGRSIRKVRQSASRLTKAGYGFRVVDAAAADRDAVREVSEAWRGNQVERGFSMSMDDLHADGTMLALAEDAGGALGGFLHLVPAGAGWSLSTMRRSPGTPNGLIEFLVVEALAWAKSVDAEELSLNFCALSDWLEPTQAVTPVRRAVRRVLLVFDRIFQLERLRTFNRKFHPEWRPRYLCVERVGDLPLVALAYLRVEQLLTPPVPWRRERVSH